MQKYLISFIIFLFNKITFYNDFMTFMSLGERVCNIQLQTVAGASHGSSSVAQYAAKWRGNSFSYSGTDNKQVCKVDLYLHYTGTTSPRTYYLLLYDDDGVGPGNRIGISDSVDVSGIGGSEVVVTFNFSVLSSALSNGTTYWIVLGSTTSASGHYASWHYISSTSQGWVYSQDANTEPSTWHHHTLSGLFKWIIYTNSDAA